jgi:PAS domain S-box-containing protein
VVNKKQSYNAPKIVDYGALENLPERFRPVAAEILSGYPTLLVTVDEHHRYLKVSEEFAQLLGYSARELIGRTVEDITPKGTIDIEFAFRISRRFGEMRGLWLFESREGKKLLCSYKARKATSEFIAELTPLFLAA